MAERLCPECPLQNSRYAALCDEMLVKSEVKPDEFEDDEAWLQDDERRSTLEPVLALQGINRCSGLRKALPSGSVLHHTPTHVPFAACPEFALMGYRTKNEGYPESE